MGAAKNRYIKVTGNVLNNLTGYDKFKGHINRYESYVINSMEYGSNTANVGKWVSNIASFAQIGIYAGAVYAGPGGWATALAWIGRGAMLTKLGAWTSTGYATYARLDYSISAAKEQNNALAMMNANYFPNVSWSFPTIY